MHVASTMPEVLVPPDQPNVVGTRPVAPDDHALLRAVASGDRQAFDQLYRTHYRSLARFVWRLLDDPNEVDDVVNEVMLVVWRKADAFRGDARVSTWILAIGFRIARKRMARSRRAPQHVPVEDVEIVAEDGPEDDARDREVRRTVRRAVAQLGPIQRVVVELTFFHGLSYPEIAEVLGCPVGTVKTRMFAARAQLRRLVPTACWELLR